MAERSYRPRRLVVMLAVVPLRLTQGPVQAHLNDGIRVVAPDATASASSSLTDLMGSCVVTSR